MHVIMVLLRVCVAWQFAEQIYWQQRQQQPCCHSPQSLPAPLPPCAPTPPQELPPGPYLHQMKSMHLGNNRVTLFPWALLSAKHVSARSRLF